MCMIEDADPADFSRAVIRRARKEHRCGECGRVIARGESYEYSTGGRSGEVWSNKSCLHCCEAAKWLSRECHGYLYGGVLEDLQLHWDDGESTMELGRLIVGIRRKWRRKDGTLMPLPNILQSVES